MTDKPSVAELLKDLRDESTLLLREEIALAKKEIGDKISSTVHNLIYIVGGALVAYCAITFLLLAISSLIARTFADHRIDIGWAIFLGFLIVAVVIGLVSIALIAKGVQTLKKTSLVPEKTVETLKEDKTWAQNKIH
jgi:hypothetical protein